MPTDLYLVETSAWVEALSTRTESTGLRRRVAELTASLAVAIVGLVRLELLGGARNDAEWYDLSDVLLGLHQLPTDEDMWDDAASIGFRLRRQGITIPSNDVLIATTAMRVGAIVLHRDRHFDVLAQHTPLRVESYVTSR